jgi:hypothetical protein
MTEKYYDIRKYYPLHSYVYDIMPSFNFYKEIRRKVSYESIFENVIGELNIKTRQLTYECEKFMKKLKTYTHDCEKLFIENNPPDYITFPNDFCVKYRQSIIHSKIDFDFMFLSETKI